MGTSTPSTMCSGARQPVDRRVSGRSLDPAAVREWHSVAGMWTNWLAHTTSRRIGAPLRVGRATSEGRAGPPHRTYQLDTSRGDETELPVQQAVRQLRPNQRQAEHTSGS